MLELKIKCPCDILTEYSNNKTKIFFEFKPNHNKYTLIKKSKEFLLQEINTFNKEIIHFFNIDSYNSSVFIYLEIDGKKVKTEKNKENYYKIVLNDVSREKKEKICLIVENVELKILIRIVNKMERKKFYTVYKKDDTFKTRDRLYTQPINTNNFNSPGISIKEKIKIRAKTKNL